MTVLFYLAAALQDLYNRTFSWVWLFPCVLYFVWGPFYFSIPAIFYCLVVTVLFFLMPGKLGSADVIAFWLLAFKVEPFLAIVIGSVLIGLVTVPFFKSAKLPYLTFLGLSATFFTIVRF